MLTLPIGSFIMFLLVAFMMASGKSSVFLNLHSFLMVVVGSLAVLIMMTPTSEMGRLIRNILAMGRRQTSDDRVRTALLSLSSDRDAVVAVDNPLIAQAQLLWRQGIDKSLFEVMLSQRLEELNKETEGSVVILRNMAKYPPALGMTGTVIGLVNVFSSLSASSRDTLGPSLALALTATFYGLLMANAMIMPLADRIQALHITHVKNNERIFQVLMLIQEGEPIEALLKRKDGTRD